MLWALHLRVEKTSYTIACKEAVSGFKPIMYYLHSELKAIVLANQTKPIMFNSLLKHHTQSQINFSKICFSYIISSKINFTIMKNKWMIIYQFKWKNKPLVLEINNLCEWSFSFFVLIKWCAYKALGLCTLNGHPFGSPLSMKNK